MFRICATISGLRPSSNSSVHWRISTTGLKHAVVGDSASGLYWHYPCRCAWAGATVLDADASTVRWLYWGAGTCFQHLPSHTATQPLFRSLSSGQSDGGRSSVCRPHRDSLRQCRSSQSCPIATKSAMTGNIIFRSLRRSRALCATSHRLLNYRRLCCSCRQHCGVENVSRPIASWQKYSVWYQHMDKTPAQPPLPVQ